MGIDSREAVVVSEGRSVDAPRLRDRSDRESAGETDSYLQVTAEVDPFRIKQLDSRWVAFYRKVWWSERRYVQGFVVDIQEYLKAQLTADLENSALPEHAAYLVFYRGVPLAPFSKGEASTSKPLLLFRSVLPHPLSQFQLALTVAEQPKGPGYQVVNLLAVFLTVLVIGGVIGMYRLTATQLELSQKKSDFVAAVSHELRTPLASLRLYGEMLVEGWVQDEEKKRDYYRHIHEESERLSRLIQNVLRLSELERNEWHVKMEACDPVGLVEGVVERVRKQIERAGFEVVITVEGNPQRFQTDVDAVTQILINLIDNAIKFSKDSETRKLILTISQESDDCSLRVRDFGPGIPKRQIKKVFERFYRVDSEMTRGTRGTGIGLAMVKMLADAMQARVDVVNRQPGVEVSVCFPTSGEKTPS